MAGLFPDPRHAPADAPLAVGAVLQPDVLAQAYRQGIFPWPDGWGHVYWWSPDPRAVFIAGRVHRSRSLQRLLRRQRFTITRDQAFGDVVRACADRPGEGTWITHDLIGAYEQLHDRGMAHSLEVWEAGELVGGIYGIAVGGVFTGESMFHRVDNASKVALACLDDHLVTRGFTLLDAQMHTEHLESMGVELMPRSLFLGVLDEVGDAVIAFR